MNELSRKHYQELAAANYALNLREIREEQTVLASWPPYLQIDLIGVCNMRPTCRMCVLDIDQSLVHKGMALEDLEGLGPFLDYCTQITNCSTGEPLIHPEILDFLALAHARSKKFGFSSNGLALTEELASKLVGFGESLAVVFSLDAATAETYAKVRCDDFALVYENIERFCRLRRALPEERRPSVALVLVPMRCNQHEIEPFFSMGARLGVDSIEVRPLIELPNNKVVTFGGFTFDYYEQMLSASELDACWRRAEAASIRYGVPFNWQHEISEEDPYVLFRPTELPPLSAPCVMPWTFILPYHNGTTVPCCYMATSIGDWRKEGLTKIWNGERLVGIRAALAAGRLADECLKSPSCPIVKEYDSVHRQRYVESVEANSRIHRFRVTDPGFQSFIESGVYEEELNEEENNLRYRWLADKARLLVPNVFAGKRCQIALRVLPDRPPECPAGILTVRVNGRLVKRRELTPNVWETLNCRVTAVEGDSLELEIECESPYLPREYGSGDRRILGVLLTEITIKRTGFGSIVELARRWLCLPWQKRSLHRPDAGPSRSAPP